MRHLLSVKCQIRSQGPAMNNKDTPITQEIPGFTGYLRETGIVRSVKFFVTHSLNLLPYFENEMQTT